MQNLKYDTNGLIYKTDIDSQTHRQTSSCQGQGEGWGGMNWEFWINKCKLFIDNE